MQQVRDYVDDDFLQQSTPRPLTLEIALGVLGEHLLARPTQTVLHPLFVLSLAAIFALLLFRAPSFLLALPLGLVTGMLIIGAYRVWLRAWEDIRLLRDGLVVRAHILKLRPNRTLAGDIDGALIDCAIALTPRRTYVGSIWLVDGHEALRLLRQGRLAVLCLPRTPGTWRVLDPIASEVRYERVGPPVAIPQDI
ncbi:MAG: hypothetical protein H7Z42_05010 [Roseiflexaceae bacterium]|nr:hypothetical protein [Roseiflexaceae bacterium]